MKKFFLAKIITRDNIKSLPDFTIDAINNAYSLEMTTVEADQDCNCLYCNKEFKKGEPIEITQPFIRFGIPILSGDTGSGLALIYILCLDCVKKNQHPVFPNF